MPLHVAIQMDPIEKLDIIGDTSFALGLEAQARGHYLWYYTPDQLSYEEGEISACGQSLTLFDNSDSTKKSILPVLDADIADNTNVTFTNNKQVKKKFG